jgi:hypothetical protein
LVQLSLAATKGLELDGIGTAEVVTIAAINVDEDYQRVLRHSFVNMIARNYDIVKAGPILVNERDDGTLWCVDGQHRMAGALQAGEEEIFAHVTHGLSKEEEAELRLARNDRKSDNVYEKFRTRLVMGDEKAHAMVALVEQHGTRLNLSVNTHTGINALVTCEVLYDAGAGQGVWLGRVLHFLNETFDGNLGGSNVSANMLKSVAWFIDRHAWQGEARLKDLQERVTRLGMEDIDRKARAHKAINGGSDWLNYYRTLVETYNWKRSDKGKLEAKTTGGFGELGNSTSAGWAHKGRGGGEH